MMSRVVSAALSCALLLSGPGCTAGNEPVTLAVVDREVSGLGASGGHVYWSDVHGFARIDVSGGLIERLSSKAFSDFVVDDTHVYSATLEGVMKMPLGGGDVIKLAELGMDEGGNASAGPIAVDASAVYWIASDGVKKVPRDGGQVTVLSPGRPLSNGLSLDESDVYWTDLADGTVKRAPREGGETRVLASGQGGATEIAVSGSLVCWLGSSRFHWAPKDEGAPESSILEPGIPTYLAVDAEHAYWLDSGSGEVRRMPLAGGEVVTIAEGELDARYIAVDDTSVYWVTPLGRHGQEAFLRKLPK